MAKQEGILKMTGTIGGITFYKSGGKFYARKTTSVDKKRLMNDPAYTRTRENMREFTEMARSGKILRDTFHPVLAAVRDKTAVHRLVAVLAKVVKLDNNSRGERTVAGGMKSALGKVLLKGFQFNKKSGVPDFWTTQCTIDEKTGRMTLPRVIAGLDTPFPEGATHVSITGAWARIDLVGGKAALIITNTVTRAFRSGPAEIKLTPVEKPSFAAGTDFFLLLVRFYQELDGVQYELGNGSYNALNIIDVL